MGTVLACVALTACPGLGDRDDSIFTDAPVNPTYTLHIKPIMAAYCDPCHGRTLKQPARRWYSDSYERYGDLPGVAEYLDEIEQRVVDQRPSIMPPIDATPMGSTDAFILETWLREGGVR